MPDSPTLRLLRAQTQAAGEASAVVFLGDNIYCCGLPDSAAAHRAEAERRLRTQLDAVKDAPGRIIFLPGNHDWNDDQRGGREAVARQEAFVETYLDRGNTFLPNDGFPGPETVKLSDDLTLIALDTQWWFSDERTFGDTGDYRLQEPTDFLLELQDVLVKHRKRNVLVAGHHPLFSNGPHGGHFSPQTYLRPGKPLYRRFVGNKQDLASNAYKLFRRELTQVFNGWPENHLIYAAGHEHSLQYFEKKRRRTSQHHIVSGSGSKLSYAAPGRGATFSASAPGFMTLQYYADTSVWLEAWTPSEDGTGKLLFRRQLKPPEATANVETLADSTTETAYPDYRDSTVVAPINPTYAQAGALRKLWFGTNNRQLWDIPVEVPVLDIAREAGGLTPIKLSGQSQSITLWMQGNDGKTYMVRSIDKVSGRTWPAAMQQTFARDLIQDQVSMLHPFAAFLAAKLADAVSIYHTNPRLVFIPDDPRLGDYRSALAGTIALFEERPDEDMSDVASMGNASNVIGYTKLMQEVNGDNDHRVDGYMWARARLLDMLLADFDRTSDNWRWGVFEPEDGKGKIYRPIPRDRDAAMSNVNGILPWIYKTRFEDSWQGFRASYGNLKGLNKKGVTDDRRFAAALTPEDWIAIADSMRAALTDEVLRKAVRTWPAPVVAQAGEQTLALLKTRRDQLTQAAAMYSRLLAQVVDVVGSNKHERFEVVRHDNGTTEVTVYKTTKEGEQRKQLYHRLLHHDETHELRLYGLDGNDQFVITGEAEDGILIRAIGGAGTDTFVDEARLRRGKHRTRLYDNATGNLMTGTEQTLVVRSDDPGINRYDPHEHRFGQRWPLVSFGSNKDDGLFIGGGLLLTRHRFRRSPYASTHRIAGNFAARTQAFNLWYQGYFTLAWKRTWDLSLSARVLFPENIRNFYGLGNETTRDAGDSRFYQAQLSQVEVKPLLVKPLETGIRLHIGPTFSYTGIEEAANRFIGQPQAGISRNTFQNQWFVGSEAGITLSTRDNAVNPAQGFQWTTTASLNIGLRNSSDTYSQVGSAWKMYLSPSLSPQVTLAARVGASHNIGSFPFFAANTLGGKSNLRGHRSTRFAGRTSFYNNLDLRVQLLDFAGYLAFGKAGMLGFLDNGRVWTDDERSDVWHQGYGFGGWVELFEATLITATADFSDEERLFSLRLGFLF